MTKAKSLQSDHFLREGANSYQTPLRIIFRQNIGWGCSVCRERGVGRKGWRCDPGELGERGWKKWGGGGGRGGHPGGLLIVIMV